MGYTHYFKTIKEPTDEQWKSITDKVEAMLLNGHQHGHVALDSTCAKPPCVDGDEISFNGCGDNAYETFSLPKTKGFNFCKTNYKKYDVFVVATLIIAKYHAPDSFEVGSDGDQGEWCEGRQLANTFLGDVENRCIVINEGQERSFTVSLEPHAML